MALLNSIKITFLFLLKGSQLLAQNSQSTTSSYRTPSSSLLQKVRSRLFVKDGRRCGVMLATSVSRNGLSVVDYTLFESYQREDEWSATFSKLSRYKKTT